MERRRLVAVAGGPRLPAPRRSRRSRRAGLAALAGSVGLALTLSACSNAGIGLARQACQHVDTSIRLYVRAEHGSDGAANRRDQVAAAKELEAALPLAARANSADPAFNPLMTTLQEMGRTSEANLLPALRAQCAAAETPTQGGVGGGTPATAATRGSPPNG